MASDTTKPGSDSPARASCVSSFAEAMGNIGGSRGMNPWYEVTDAHGASHGTFNSLPKADQAAAAWNAQNLDGPLRFPVPGDPPTGKMKVWLCRSAHKSAQGWVYVASGRDEAEAIRAAYGAGVSGTASLLGESADIEAGSLMLASWREHV